VILRFSKEESKEEMKRYWKSINEESVFLIHLNMDEELREDAKSRIRSD